MNLEKIGRYLKSVREKKDITHEDIYEKTRIQISIIEDIEEGTSSLSPVFLRGFVKTYAKFLGVSIEKHLKEDLENLHQPPALKIETSSPKKESSLRKMSLKKQAALVLIFLIPLIFLFNKKDSQTEVTTLQEEKSEGTSLPSKKLETQNLSNKKDLKNLPEEDALVKKEAGEMPLLDKMKKYYFRQEILIKSSEDLEIYFKVDDQKLETRNLSSQEWYNIKAIDKIYLRFDKVADVQVFYNGKKVVFKGQFFEKAFPSDTL